jgi:MoxR-like ATPase
VLNPATALTIKRWGDRRGLVDSSLFAQLFERLRDNVESFIRGKQEVVELALICLLSEGHLLIEDVPGVG